mgnify:CR=1 FL=1
MRSCGSKGELHPVLPAVLILQALGSPAYAADEQASNTAGASPAPVDVSSDPGNTTPEPTVAQAIAGDGRLDPYRDQDFLKSVPLFGSNWRFSFGGYAKIDLIHDFSVIGDEQQFVLATIPVDGNPQPASYTSIQLAETRFNFDSMKTGLEYMYGIRENVSGRDGDAHRLQFSLIYYF